MLSCSYIPNHEYQYPQAIIQLITKGDLLRQNDILLVILHGTTFQDIWCIYKRNTEIK